MTTWTVLRAAHPESSNLTLPIEVQRLLHLPVAKRPFRVPWRSQVERNLVFLWRPNGWARIVPGLEYAPLLKREAKLDRILAQAPFTSTSTGSLVLNLPQRVVQYLHLKDFEGADPSPRAPSDSIAWISQKDEWDLVRWSDQTWDPDFAASFIEPHVYLGRDAFEGTLPTLDELEESNARGPPPPSRDETGENRTTSVTAGEKLRSQEPRARVSMRRDARLQP